MSKLFQKMASGEMALGVWLKGGPTWVPTLARAGFDFVRPDMMFSSMDWKELDHIYRTAVSVGLTTWVRVPANPWMAGTEQMQVTVDVARAFSIGIPVVGASVSSAKQVRALVEVSKDWHRSGAGEYPDSAESFAKMNQKAADDAMFIPHVEAGTAIDELDEILSIDGLRVLMISMTDFSKAMGYPFQYDHPEVWKAVDRIVDKATARGIIIAANSGYAYTTPDQIVDRLSKLYKHGIRIVQMQGADNILEWLARALLKDVRSAFG